MTTAQKATPTTSTPTPAPSAPIASQTDAPPIIQGATPTPGEVLGKCYARLSGALNDRPDGVGSSVAKSLIAAALADEDVQEWVDRVKLAARDLTLAHESLEASTRGGYPVGDRRVSLSLGETYAALTGKDSADAKARESETWKKMHGR